MKTVLIAGGTGLVGMRLSQLLKNKGYNVLHLSRNRQLDAQFPAYEWNIEEGTIDEDAFQKADYIINLAGAGIADKPWSSARKKAIINSRVNSNRLIKAYIEREEFNPSAYISASAIGYYGDSGEQLVDEESEAGKAGFLPESVKLWEKSIETVAATGIRTVYFRIGLVLSTKGGALEKILLPFSFNLGVYFGHGKQWYSWIHIDDLANMFIQAIENEQWKGVYNAVSPQPERNKSFTEKIAKGMGKSSLFLPAPAFALKLAMGEMADAVLISTKVSAKKIQEAGFNFQFPEIKNAVADLIQRKI